MVTTATGESEGTTPAELTTTTEVVSSETTPQPSTTEPPELAEYRQLNQKLQRDLNSLRGTVRSQDEIYSAITERLDALGKQVSVIGRSQATGDTERLATELVQIEQEQGQQAAQRLFNQEAESQRAYMVELLSRTDESGQTLINPQDHIVQEASQEFLQAWESADSPTSRRLSQMSQAARKLSQRAAELAWESARAEARKLQDLEQRLASAQLDETDIEPGGSGAAPTTDADLFAAYGRGEPLTPQEKARAMRYRQQLLRGR